MAVTGRGPSFFLPPDDMLFAAAQIISDPPPGSALSHSPSCYTVCLTIIELVWQCNCLGLTALEYGQDGGKVCWWRVWRVEWRGSGKGGRGKWQVARGTGFSWWEEPGTKIARTRTTKKLLEETQVNFNFVLDTALIHQGQLQQFHVSSASHAYCY